MKLYKTTNGIVIEKNNSFFLVQNENWDSFINDDDLLKKLKTLFL